MTDLSPDDFRCELIHWKVQRRGGDNVRRCHTAATCVALWKRASHLLSRFLDDHNLTQSQQPPASCPEASTHSFPRKHTLFWFVLPAIILCLSKPTKSVSRIEKTTLKQKGLKDTAEIFKRYGGKRSSSAPFAHKSY